MGQCAGPGRGRGLLEGWATLELGVLTLHQDTPHRLDAGSVAELGAPAPAELD